MQTVRAQNIRREQLELVESPEASACGSYGRSIYAGHSTFGLDFCHQGSYGRGIYAGHNTFNLDFDTPGSYGRGIYADHSTYDLDFRRKDSYARGMGQLPERVTEWNTKAALRRTQH